MKHILLLLAALLLLCLAPILLYWCSSGQSLYEWWLSVSSSNDDRRRSAAPLMEKRYVNEEPTDSLSANGDTLFYASESNSSFECSNILYTIPYGVKVIAKGTFRDIGRKMIAIRVEGGIPPKVENGAFDPINRQKCTLGIPEGSEHRYHMCNGWKTFKHTEHINYISLKDKTVLREETDDGYYRELFAEKKEEEKGVSCTFYMYDSKSETGAEVFKLPYTIYSRLYIFVSPDKRYVYAVPVTDGPWYFEYRIFQMDLQTSNTTYMNYKCTSDTAHDGAATVRVCKDGFVISKVYQIIKFDSKGDNYLTFKDFTFDFNGNLRQTSKEYSQKKWLRKYKRGTCNLKEI